MKPYLKHYFTFSASEKRGLLLLCLLIVIVSVAPYVFDAAGINDKQNNQIPPAIDSFEKAMRSAHRSDVTAIQEYFPFNPNTASVSDFLKLGLSNKEAEAIEHYRKKGGHFYKKVDFLKLYLISKEEYLALYPYIQLDKNSSWNNRGFTKNQARIIDINKAGVEDWQNLPGIGPVYAGRIVHYREARKFFSSKQDLLQVYGIDSLLFNQISRYLSIDSILIDSLSRSGHSKVEPTDETVRINLNTADTTLLKSLKGIGSFYSKKIVQYRLHLGGFISVNQLLEISNFRTETLDAIKSRIYLEEGQINKLSLNHSSFDDFEMHPYISRAIAEYIVNRRNRMPFKNIEEIKTSFLVDDDLYRKLAPYLAL